MLDAILRSLIVINFHGNARHIGALPCMVLWGGTAAIQLKDCAIERPARPAP